MKKLLGLLLISGLLSTGAFALVESSKKADTAADKTVAHATKADKNITEAKNLLDQGKPAQAKEAVTKAAASSAVSKTHAEKTAAATETVKTKAQNVAATTVTAKKATQETKTTVKKAKDATEQAQNITKEASEAAKTAQDAHKAGDTKKAEEHTQKAVGFLGELMQKLEDVWANLFTADKKATTADTAVKAQMLLVTPKSKKLRRPHRREKGVLRPQALIINGSDL